MRTPYSNVESDPIQGQLLMLDDQRKIAIHSHGGELWVAEFHNGRALLYRATTWFQFHCGIGRTSFALRRALQCAVPLSDELAAVIETLHQRRSIRTSRSSSRVWTRRNAGHRASVVLAKLLQCLSLLRERLAASEKSNPVG